jgi:translocator protein
MRIPVSGTTSYRGRNSRPNLPVLAAFVGIALTVGAWGALFSPGLSSSATHWYNSLAKPAWLPPNSWFAPVWIVLYVSMGSAAWLIWRERYHRVRNAALTAYGVQLTLNALWPPLFFGEKSIDAGFFVIVVLWLSIAWTLREFARVKPAAAWRMVPYFVWVGIAVAMNLSLWKLNK